MKSSKNLNFKEQNKKVSLEEVILFCVETTIDLASFPLDNNLSLRTQHEISIKYNINDLWAVAALYRPVWWYLTLDEYVQDKKTDRIVVIREAFIPSNGYNEWYVSDNVKKLTKSEKIKIVKAIIEKPEVNYKERLKKFNLDILFL
jgi:hypothetical protein